MLTDIEIAKSVKLRPINDIAAEMGINENLVENYGRYVAKISTNIIDKKSLRIIILSSLQPSVLRRLATVRLPCL